MAIRDVWMKAKDVLSASTSASEDIGDIYLTRSLKEQGLFKAYMPKYLYNPPFGYPREENLVLARKLSQNPYIYSIEKTIAEEVALAEWKISYKEDSEKKDQLEDLKLQITKFFNNPNQNKESFCELRKMAVRDIINVDAGVWVKVFNRKNELCQMFARDGSSFLKNPDIYGYMGNRDDIIAPLESSWQMGQIAPNDLVKQYSAQYRNRAAYFQYGTSVTAAVPIPFGRRELIYMNVNPRSESPYGKSPISILADLIVVLVYGSSYNLDFYMNNNMPEGIISLIGANADEIKAFRSRIEKEFRVQDDTTGFMRKTAFKVPITQTDAKFIPFQLDPKTMQILEQQDWFYKLALACFGIPQSAMGFEGGDGLRTGDGDNQLKLYLRKSARYIMATMKYKIDNEILPEFGEEAWENLEFTWEEYDLDEELKKYQLYQQQYNLQIITPKQIAEKEGLDFTEVQQHFEEKQQKEMDMAQAGKMEFNQNVGADKNKGASDGKESTRTAKLDKKEDKKDDKKKEKDTKTAKAKPETEFERNLVNMMRTKQKQIKAALEKIE